jgi:two-component system CheB/CheR fusion protein
VTPDQAEEDAAGQDDDAVPSRGYELLPVVGLGAAEGGAQALHAFFQGAGTGGGLAFVVVLNQPGTDADADADALAQLLRQSTAMPVVPVTGRLRMAPGTVHIMPPGTTPRMRGDIVEPVPPPARAARHLPVDMFFRTLADTHGPHAMAVVLSGADGDGVLGIKRVKERGGLTIAQDPQEAAQGGMPQAAIATGMIDWVLPAREMGARIGAYLRIEGQLHLPSEQPPQERDESAPGADVEETIYREVLAFVRSRTGRDFDDYKRATVLRRLGRRMQVNGVSDLKAYLDCLRTRPGEAGALLDDMLISVTNFFRDGDCFAALEALVPELFRHKGQGDTLRVWVVACATGEEAYSIAMLLSEHARTLSDPPAIQVFATDLDEDAVRTAREGVYPAAAEADLSEERLRQFFVREPRGLRVRRELREMVLFAVHDVLRDSPFSRVDLASCRNLLIYLNRHAQARVLETLHFALRPGAPLFLGASEAVDERSPLFAVSDKRHRVFTARQLPRSDAQLPARHGRVTGALEARRSLSVIPDAAIAPPLQKATLLPTLPDGRIMSWAEMHMKLIDLLAAPSILVDADNEMLHISAAATGFLYFSGGEPSRNVLLAIAPDLKAELQTALYHAGERRAAVNVAPVRVRLGDGQADVSISVRPVDAFGKGFLVLLQREAGGEVDVPGSVPGQDAGADVTLAPVRRLDPEPIAQHLEREVGRLKTHLRETVEQYEVSTEELKASNEELHAMNEELHSATEELETSREELQSINEELITVNQELKNKVDDLGQANSDMMNLMDATAIATVFLDREFRVTRFTPSAVTIFKLIATDLGRPLSDLTTRLEYPQLDEDARAVLRTLQPSEREVGDAAGNWYLARARPYRTIEDMIAGVVLTFVDITERKTAQESLRRSQERYSAIVNQASVGVVQTRLDGEITFANTCYCALMGYEESELVGRRAIDLVHALDNARVEGLFGRLAAHGEPFETESRSVRKDGSIIWLHKSVTVLTERDGRPDSALIVCSNVSERKYAEEALRESEERVRLMLENAVDYAIFSVDMERHVTSWNTGAERLLGYSEHEILGRSADVIFTEEDRAADAPGIEVRTALAAGRAADDRLHQRKDGSRFWASGALMPMHNGEGTVIGMVKVLRDQSEQRAAQEELEQSRGELLSALRANEAARRALETADAAKDRFLAILSHELRNPLASIGSAAELLVPESLATQDQVRAARVIRRQASVMRVLLGELLDVSSLRRGQLALRLERITAQAIAEAALEATRPLVEQGSHTLVLDIAEEEIPLDADPIRLSQVVSNLLSNAAKYTPAEGRIVLSVRADARDAVFQVTDNGIGMEPDTVDAMFEMFAQSERAHDRAAGGLGIGLALVRNIAELHGGAVAGQSEGLGRGSRFTVRIPLARAQAAAGLPAPAAAEEPGTLRRLLLADDNVDALWGMAQMLSMAGFTVDSVHNGIDALRMAQQLRPDAAVLDIGMPGLDGHEVARRIRAEPWGRDMFLVAATGWGQPDDKAAAMAAGFDEHLVKPVAAADLQRLLRARQPGERPSSGDGG